MKLDGNIPRINFKAIKPQVNLKKDKFVWKTWSPIPLHIYFYINEKNKRFYLSIGTTRENIEPILQIESILYKDGRYNRIYFPLESTLHGISNIKEETDGTIKISWWYKINPDPSTNSPESLIIKPDGTVKVKWYKYAFGSYNDYIECIYDKQGNLLYFYNDYTPQKAYELELLSPGLYNISFNLRKKRSIKRWASFMNRSKSTKVIHI